ncbi:NarL family two-component system sensor histidine kinase LiaS [Virgibacillus halotolerans]|uniref:sensor histidine kinase n=1 Tax=Virgibacillus halotolerans TaxID=1071053 RepID=UPI00195FADEC|nr:sensor histidine kinase [Virgibacillus halotolerans]MBM7601679.1 NarL family two-component system sensor histidine kinase LiaS [Virgibacillus halotolerans]
MIKRFNSIRFRYIRSHLYAMFITTVTLLSVLLTIHVLINPDWLNETSIFVFILLYVLLGIIISFYAGFKSSDSIKVTLDSISVLITQFANGNYESSMHINQDSEFSRIASELNHLGEKLQNQVKSLQRMADEKSEFAKSAHKSAVMEERQRLARDLHDAVSQQLFALTMMSEAAVKQLEKDPETAKEQMKDVAKAALQSQTEMRALLLHLRPVHLSGDSLPTGIHKLINELKQKSQISFHVRVPDDLSLSETIEEHIFRIVQESLTNILRHAAATEVTVNLSKRETELFVHIRDNGKGFDIDHYSDRKASYGLKTMRERSEELGGTFTVKSNVNEGTYIDIRIPC